MCKIAGMAAIFRLSQRLATMTKALFNRPRQQHHVSIFELLTELKLKGNIHFKLLTQPKYIT